jgi:integrase
MGRTGVDRQPCRQGRGKSTVKRTWLAACRTVLRWAVKRKRIAVSPFADVEVSVPRKIITRETGRGFTDAETSIILQAAAKTTVRDERSASRRWMPWLMAYTGARAGEVAQLRAGDVDLTRKARLRTPGTRSIQTHQRPSLSTVRAPCGRYRPSPSPPVCQGATSTAPRPALSTSSPKS